MGYAKAIKRLNFPDLSEDDDPIWVEIRNPKTLPLRQLMPDSDVETDADGKPMDRAAATMATFGILAGLVTNWHVYNATSDDDQPLPLPATAAHIDSLPFEIQQELMAEMKAVTGNP